MVLRRFGSVGLGIVLLMAAAPNPAVAEAHSHSSRPEPQWLEAAPLTTPTVAISASPDLPPIRPIFPEVAVERRVVIKLNQRRVYVYEGDRLKKSYPVAVGRAGWETPTGQFQVIGMVSNPGWTNPFTREVLPPGPDNPLGERWIAFWTDGRNAIGFHGTPDRASVGTAASHGCVRMFNEDIRELYEIVAVGTPVMVEL